MAFPKTGHVSTDNKDSFANDAKRDVSRRVLVGDNRYNTFKAVKTTVTTSATFINVPEDATRIVIYHIEADETLWLGENAQITAGGTGTAPMQTNFTLELEVIKGNGNNIYGIVSSGSIDVYAIAMTKE